MAHLRVNAIYASRSELQRQAHIQETLGDSEICGRCKATLATYGDACVAPLNEPCPGFEAVERASASFMASGRGQ